MAGKTSTAKLIIIIIVLLIGLLAYLPPQAEYMPEEYRFEWVVFPLLPPLLAITLAMLTGEVLPSLFLGIWVGALIFMGYDPIKGTTQTLSWMIDNVTNSWNATILMFDFIIGAWVGVLYLSGAMHSLAERISKGVNSARRASLVAAILGVIVFFDDYSNTTVVGNASRPLTDRTRVSRELLSYIIDSTAAPVAGMMLVSTWIGFEVGLIRDSLKTLAEEAMHPTISEYPMWLSALPFHFYSIFALIMVFIVITTRRHFGPMLDAEYRVVTTGKVLRDGAAPLMPTETVLGEPAPGRKASLWVFVISIAILIGITLLGMWYTGWEAMEVGGNWWEASFVDALYEADSARALLWGSFAAYLFTLSSAVLSGSLGFRESIRGTVKGMYLMVYANAILVLAWSIKSATDSIGTARYVVYHALSLIPPTLIPLLIFAVAMFISYTTGTSWGTFSVMMPIAIPLAWKAGLAVGSVELAYILSFASIGAVFGGGIYGDHVSPISDTTIMSSMFSGADHIDHVRTQLPYGTLAAFVSVILYILLAILLTISYSYYWSFVLLAIGLVLLIALHRVLNKLSAKRKSLPEKLPDYVVS